MISDWNAVRCRVTETDRSNEALIQRGLSEAFPEDGFLGEVRHCCSTSRDLWLSCERSKMSSRDRFEVLLLLTRSLMVIPLVRC